MNAQSIAVREKHQEVDEAHLFLALLEENDSLMDSIIEKFAISFPRRKKENKYWRRNHVLREAV